MRAGHDHTQQLYARFGFVPVGVRRSYYSDPVEDAVVMWLHDLDGADAVQRRRDLAAVGADPVASADPVTEGGRP